MRHPWRRILAGGALVLALASAGPAQSPGRTPDERALAEHGIQPEPESIRRFLRLVFPDEELRNHIDVLVRQLGDRSPELRDAARRELLELRAAPLGALRLALEDDSPEVRRAARALIERADADLDTDVLYAVLRTIRYRQLHGLAREVLHALPLANDYYLRAETRRTLLAIVRPDDLPMLRAALSGTPEEVRAGALVAIAALDPRNAVEVLAPALRNPSPAVRFTAALELAQLGDRRALPTLVELLESGPDRIRFRAQRALQVIAGRTMDRIDASPDRWRTWLAEEGRAIEWKTPLRLEEAALGRTLIALYGKDKVMEIDATGRVVWEVGGLSKPWAVHGTPNGHRLVTLYNEHRILEFDAAGARIWDSGPLEGMVSSVWVTRRGLVLAAMGYSQNRIVEIDRATKRVAWELAVPGRPVHAQELESGNILVTLNESNEVVELDRSGKQVWKAEGFNQPYSALRLANGHTLVCDFGNQRIVEVDRAGEPVWQFPEPDGKPEPRPLHWAYTAARLDDGTTLFGVPEGLNRVNRKGDVVWRLAAPTDYLYLHRY